MTAMGIIFDPMTPNIAFKRTADLNQDNPDISSVASIDFDALLEENHEWSNEVSTSPVENGSPVADHIIPNPDKFRCTAMISDSSIFGFTDGDNESLTQKTFNLIRQLHKDRQTITVYTKYFQYDDMAISNVGIPRSSSNGDSLSFNLEFINLRIVNTQTTKVPEGISKKLDKKTPDSVVKKTDPQKTTGAKQGAPAAEKPTSILSGILG